MNPAAMGKSSCADDNSSLEECYHCGLPVLAGRHYCVHIDGSSRNMCCIGCQAVAQSIVDSDLTDYYRHRDAMPESRKEALPVALQELGLFDHPDFQKEFVQPIGEYEHEASLILEGITCAACVWLNEQHIARQPGIRSVQINYATRRARIRWDERESKLSDILAAIQSIGYRAYPYDASRAEQLAHSERRTMLWRLFVAGFGMMQVMMYAFPSYFAKEGDLTLADETIMRWASLLLTLPVVLYSAAPFFRRAWRDIRLRHLGMDVPVALGVGSAFVASLWATLSNGPQVYFDSVTMFVFFLLCGRYLEMLARQKAVRGVDELGKVLPVFAQRLGAEDGLVERVPVSILVPGDHVWVRPGEVIPADAVVLQGDSAADEALLTGESRPVPKQIGAEVTGGTINVSSPLLIEIRQVGDSTRLASIRRLMERAAADRPRLASQAEQVARIFIVSLLVLAMATYLFWHFYAPERAIWVFVSVLVVACPCALSLATPAALTVVTDTLVRMGVLVTRGHAIEGLATANRFVFDKTGTLTYGRMRLDCFRLLGEADETMVLSLAAALELSAEHPVAAALREAATERELELPPTDKLRVITGRGVEAWVDGRRVRIGRPDFVAEIVGVPMVVQRQSEVLGSTLLALGDDSGWLALFELADTVRADADVLCAQLASREIATAIISGDADSAVQEVARSLGIRDAHGEMTPQDKQRWVAKLQQETGAVVAMVGDGVNDAPVLAQAQVSVAMGGGTDLARNQADIVLLSQSLAGLGAAIGLAQRTLRIIRQNLWWSFTYNAVSIPLAMLGLVAPWMAGVGMAGSSLLVVVNALRLRRLPAPGRQHLSDHV